MTVTSNRIPHRPHRARRPHHVVRAHVAVLTLSLVMSAGMAQTPPPGAAKSARKAAPKAAASKHVEFIIPAASADQIDAAGQVFYGTYECEFKQTVQITADARHPSYVNVKHGKADYLMKPVLSSTGAIRLEDVRGDTLMVQISSKSMLLNVKTAQRIVDDCVSPKQRELIEVARVAKVAAVAAAAASAASAASPSSAASAASPASPASAASDAAAASAPAAAPASLPASAAPAMTTVAPTAPTQ